MKGLYIIVVESHETVGIISSWYLFNVCVITYYYVMAGFLTSILFYCFMYGGCTLSTYSQVDEEYMWDVLVGGDEQVSSV